MRKLFLLLLGIAVMVMAGCASSLMQRVDPGQMSEMVKSDEAAIVFFRPNLAGGGIQSYVIEGNEDGNVNFVAVISSRTKYLHRTTPGRHLYFVGRVGGFGQMLEANLEAGKTYYAYIFLGLLMGVIPVSDPSDEALKKYLASCNWVQNTPEGQDWFQTSLPSLQGAYTKALTAHQAAAPEAKALMLPEYGTDTPLR